MDRAGTRTKGVLFAVVLTVSVLTAGAGAAQAAGGGNSANAKLCQQGGWQSLVTQTGQGFANAGECVSYAAQGGTLSPKLTPLQRWEAICTGAGGTVGITTGQWVCDGAFFVQATADALAGPCAEAGGNPVEFGPPEPIYRIECNFS